MLLVISNLNIFFLRSFIFFSSVSDVTNDSLFSKSLKNVIEKIENTVWNKKVLLENAKRFSKDKFVEEMLEFIKLHAQKKNKVK